MQKNELGLYLTTNAETNYKYIKDLSIKIKTIELSEDNTSINYENLNKILFHVLGCIQ
jgi:hypothetical protein